MSVLAVVGVRVSGLLQRLVNKRTAAPVAEALA